MFISLLFIFSLLIPTLNKYLIFHNNSMLLIVAYVIAENFMWIYYRVVVLISLEVLFSFCKRKSVCILGSPKSIQDFYFPRKSLEKEMSRRWNCWVTASSKVTVKQRHIGCHSPFKFAQWCWFCLFPSRENFNLVICESQTIDGFRFVIRSAIYLWLASLLTALSCMLSPLHLGLNQIQSPTSGKREILFPLSETAVLIVQHVVHGEERRQDTSFLTRRWSWYSFGALWSWHMFQANLVSWDAFMGSLETLQLAISHLQFSLPWENSIST